jgi:hypothetical protein
MCTNGTASDGIVTARTASNGHDSHSASPERERPDSQATDGHKNANGATAQSKYTHSATAERKNAASEPTHCQPTSRYVADCNNPASMAAKFSTGQVRPQSDCPQGQAEYLALGLAADAPRHPLSTAREQQRLGFVEFTLRQSALLTELCEALKFFSQVHSFGLPARVDVLFGLRQWGLK